MQNSVSILDQMVSKKFEKQIPFVMEVLITALGSIALAVSSQVSFHFAFNPVPFALTTFVLFMFALTLGVKRSVGITVLYIAEGLSGLPVFAGGNLGLPALIGPSGGFIMAYPFVVWVTSTIYNTTKINSKVVKTVLAVAMGYVVLFGIGSLWLSQMVGMTKAIQFAVIPFLPIEGIKLAVLSIIVPYLNEKI